MENKIIFENYIKSLEQKYNAVCLDIDGTLTMKKSKDIDPRSIRMIIELLRKKIPVVFITGRGESGLNDFKSNIYEFLKNNKNITEDDIKRIYVLTNDGARLFYSKFISSEKFLNENSYITTKDELKELLKVNNLVKKIKEKTNLGKIFDLNYSRDLKTQDILNIRMLFDIEDNKIVDMLFDNISDYIYNSNLKSINLTRGFYKDRNVIQIATTTKDKAIRRAEKIIGVPENSMMRIGDCGDFRGNDYSILNCNQGYSVDKTSGSINSCFPIFDKKGNIMTGVEATLYLINNAKILPAVCLEKADKLNYKYNFSKAEKEIVLKKQKILSKYNRKLKNNFSDCCDIFDLFDKFSGSIKIPMYEMEFAQENPLKELWLSTKNKNLNYSLKDDNNYLLRGSKTYYYFIANRISDNGKDITSKEDVINWYNNYLAFLTDAIYAISKTKDLNNQINKKFILGVMDNSRNVLLIY